MKCPLCGYYMASLDTECLRCHGKGLSADAADDENATPLPGAPLPVTASQNPPSRFVSPHAVPQAGGANANANPALRDDPVLAELNRNPRRVVLTAEHGLSFTTIFLLCFVVFVVLPWGCTAIFSRPQPHSDLTLQLNTHDRDTDKRDDTATSQLPDQNRVHLVSTQQRPPTYRVP